MREIARAIKEKTNSDVSTKLREFGTDQEKKLSAFRGQSERWFI